MSSSSQGTSTAGIRKFSIGAILIGLAIAALSFLPSLAAGTKRWTPDKAREFQKASLEIQELSHTVVSQTPDSASRETSTRFQKAIDNFESLRTELEEARSHNGSLAAVLRLLGGTLIVGGIVGCLATIRIPKGESGVHLRRNPPSAGGEISG